ncbi:hypothetical protein [Corynebacterium imitans]|uniref:hypothetical protein n=1 Tax=Corynebacterium imitans TaxID=156978 RepID=UPI001185A8C0|nr:hypothetical protein [Corynebacterium imitans]
MCNTEGTSRTEKEQAEYAGDAAPAGVVTVDRALIREKNQELRELGRKICNTCGVEQDLNTDFQPDKRLLDGRAGRCRTCANKQLQTSRAAADGLAYALERGHRRAREAGLPAIKFTRAELLVYWDDLGINPWECFHTGVQLRREPGYPNSRTFDHVQPLSVPGTAGHVIENVVPCSRDYNRHKSATSAVLAVLNRDPEQYPGVEYPGPVDEHGNPLAPALVEWSDSDREPVVISLDSEGKQVLA